MPLWDSVQRSLEKASHEAARIAKAQRLRSTIDGLTRQLNTQSNNLVNKAMDLFSTGQLTQGELLPLCQEITNLQQQMNQAINELKQIQATQPQTTGPQTQPGAPNPYLPLGPGGQTTYPSTGEGLPPNDYTTPDHQAYLDSTQGMAVPPPPPGAESLTISSAETMQMSAEIAPPPSTGAKRCAVCHAELAPNNAFCHSCGAPVQDINSPHLPTVRGGTLGQTYFDGQVLSSDASSNKETGGGV